MCTLCLCVGGVHVCVGVCVWVCVCVCGGGVHACVGVWRVDGVCTPYACNCGVGCTRVLGRYVCVCVVCARRVCVCVCVWGGVHAVGVCVCVWRGCARVCGCVEGGWGVHALCV